MIKLNDRESRHGLVLNITGDGKGKTTSAIGTAVRALGWGWRVCFIQFAKSATFVTGEKLFFSDVPNIDFIQFGGTLDCSPDKQQEYVQEGWRKACESILERDYYDLVVLDELNFALNMNWLQCSEVVNLLKKRPKYLHVIITGRNALKELCEESDLVSDIVERKHHFNQNVSAQKGVEF